MSMNGCHYKRISTRPVVISRCGSQPSITKHLFAAGGSEVEDCQWQIHRQVVPSWSKSKMKSQTAIHKQKYSRNGTNTWWTKLWPMTKTTTRAFGPSHQQCALARRCRFGRAVKPATRLKIRKAHLAKNAYRRQHELWDYETYLASAETPRRQSPARNHHLNVAWAMPKLWKEIQNYKITHITCFKHSQTILGKKWTCKKNGSPWPEQPETSHWSGEFEL